VAYQFGKNKQPHYAIEGSISVAGLALNWLKNNLNLISDFQECEKLAAPVTCTGGVYFVPAFSGLYAPLLENGYQRVRFKKINKLTEIQFQLFPIRLLTMK
jgi:glycerol kinase